MVNNVDREVAESSSARDRGVIPSMRISMEPLYSI